jgi:hypothetical protein
LAAGSAEEALQRATSVAGPGATTCLNEGSAEEAL